MHLGTIIRIREKLGVGIHHLDNMDISTTSITIRLIILDKLLGEIVVSNNNSFINNMELNKSIITTKIRVQPPLQVIYNSQQLQHQLPSPRTISDQASWTRRKANIATLRTLETLSIRLSMKKQVINKVNHFAGSSNGKVTHLPSSSNKCRSHKITQYS
jgi:hypothetical protein